MPRLAGQLQANVVPLTNDIPYMLRDGRHLIDASDWQIINSILLQGADEKCQQFIGDYCFNHDETLCAVARPFSGDVVAVDMNKFEVTSTCTLGDQPLSVALMSDGTVYSRDWKTGKLLRGTLKKM